MKPVKKSQVRNFAKENLKTSKKVTNVATEGVRDAFGHILSMEAVREAVDLKEILSYPITSTPLAFAHSDGTPTKTEKSVLTKLLEKSRSLLYFT